MKSQKQIIILLVITASLTSFLAGYLFMQSNGQSDQVIQQQRGQLIDRFEGVNSSDTPTPLAPGLYQASTDLALAPVNAADSDSVLYYHPDTGFVSKLDLESRSNDVISQASLPGLIRVIWSPDRNRVIIVSKSRSGFDYAYFDYTTRAHGSLGANILDAAFSPDSNKIAVVTGPQGGENNIQIEDLDGQNPKIILKTRLNNIKLFWPAENLISFTADDESGGTRSIYATDEQGNLSDLVDELDNSDTNWSPGGLKLIYSDLENNVVVLHLFDPASEQDQVLPIQTTASNCAWTMDQKNLLCAEENAGQTSIAKIGLADDSVQTLFSNLIITPNKAFLSHLEDFLILISASDQTIWTVKLGN